MSVRFYQWYLYEKYLSFYKNAQNHTLMTFGKFMNDKDVYTQINYIYKDGYNKYCRKHKVKRILQ